MLVDHEVLRLVEQFITNVQIQITSCEGGKMGVGQTKLILDLIFEHSFRHLWLALLDLLSVRLSIASCKIFLSKGVVGEVGGSVLVQKVVMDFDWFVVRLTPRLLARFAFLILMCYLITSDLNAIDSWIFDVLIELVWSIDVLHAAEANVWQVDQHAVHVLLADVTFVFTHVEDLKDKSVKFLVICTT